ncbi:nitroreductase family protein [Bradyrhizobium sp. CCBAU 51753]|uniref:nitroreductase family protein n=1 Tax=Bradyrhizobium sp. CCBAU 51753 TaxID=1325100 RepID=UPI001FED494F|nr:nitroreductase family protein [Bradyrhizobium sp. CCBAU 51753]
MATPVDTNSGVLEGQCGVGDELSRTTTGNTGRHRIAAAPSDHPQIYREDQLMSACSEAVARRFGDGGPSGAGAEESDLICRVLSRKTVRRYSDRMPAEALLDLLVACALSASAKSDFQQASILRVRDPEKRAAVGKLFPAMPWIGIAPVFFVFLGDARRLQRIGEMRGKPVENGTLEGFFNASIDAALAMQTMILSAESVGLGVCPISVLRNEIDGVAGILGLPNLVFPVAGLCLGYPQAEGHVSLRLPRGVTAHRDSYDDSGLAAAIDDYDRRRDALHAIPKEQQRANAEFGEAAFYGWSEDKARQVAKAEGAAFPPYLRAHGFSLD